MPYTANRQFKANPRLLVSARDMHYVAADGRRILDGTAGLWCCNAGHARPRIVEAVQKQIVELDYAPAFQMGHPKAFELSSRLVQLAPRGLDHVFFTNSGSEAVRYGDEDRDRLSSGARRGLPLSHDRSREGLSWLKFGGISVGGIGRTARCSALCSSADHLPAHARPARNAFSRGLPETRRRVRRRPGAPDRAARRVEHRRGDRRAVRGLAGVRHPAAGLSPAAARDLRQARHPADLRRGHHRLRPRGRPPRPRRSA